MNAERVKKKLELQKQIKLIEDEEARELADKRAKREKFLEDNLDHLIALVPEHHLANCNDDNLSSRYVNCTRCQLLRMKNTWGATWDSDYDVEIQLVKR